MLKAGIVGLPNVGKSTLFNAVTRTRKAEAANYPFCTIDPNIGVVNVPDARLEVLSKISGSAEIIPASVEFVAHENTQRLMRENNGVRGLGPARESPFDGNNANGIPERTFTDTLTLGSGADRVELHYFGRAHTGGDTWVVFPALRVMHAGDAFPAKMVPIMDSNNGGSGIDYPDTLRKAFRGITNVDRIITGHSTVMTPADLSEYADFVSWFLSDVRAGKARGESAAEFVSGWQVPSMYSGYNKGPAERLQAYVQDIYDDLP